MHTTTLLPEKSKGVYTSFVDGDLQSYIAECHENYLNSAIELGKNHGRRNYPDENCLLKDATETITTNYSELISFSKQKLNALLQIKQGSEDQNKMEQVNKKLYTDLDLAESELEKVKCCKIEEPPLKTPRYLFLLGLILFCLILFGEVFYVAKSLQVTRLNFYQSMIIAFSISLSIGAIAHYAPRKINEWCKNMFLKFIANLVVFGLVFLVFMVISYLRSSYMLKVNNQETSVWIFTIFNFLLFIGLFFIDIGLIQPNWQKIKAIRLYEKQQKMLKELENKVENLKSVIEQNKNNLYEQNSQRLLLISYAKSVEEQIVKLYHISVSQYKESNRYHRESASPLCLNENPTPIELHYSHIKL